MADQNAPPPNIDERLVRDLIAEQFPYWAGLDITAVASDGTDNYLARLGKNLCVRMPKVEWASNTPVKEYTWGRRFSDLSVKTPTPHALGQPSLGYPWNWSVCDWIEGRALGFDRFDDEIFAVKVLEVFLRELQAFDVSDGPKSGPQNHYRGAPLSMRDAPMRQALTALSEHMDTGDMTRLWDKWLGVPTRTPKPQWLHGDLHGGNILIDETGMLAVIDFGLVGVGDAACDLMAGWTLFAAEPREVFRKSMQASDADWLRGAAWALSVACIGLAYYKETNAELSARAKRTIEQVVADFT